LQEPQNYSDLIYIYGSIVNVILQRSTDSLAFHNKLLMTVILLQQIIKTFFFLRIFETLSYIVTMIYSVIYDLRIFLFFYGILLLFFCLIFAVLGVGNHRQEGHFQDMYNSLIEEEGEDPPSDFPNEEYKWINPLMGYLFSALRTSLGDNDFSASTYLTVPENYLFWVLWFLVTTITCIIFLNFIIAEASASYENVKSRLDAMIFKEKASLIAEAEDMYTIKFKNDQKFPKYIIIRKIET